MAKLSKPRSTKGFATFCAKIADDKIAKDILILDLTELDSAPTDYFVICTCESDTQVEAVVHAIDKTMDEIDFTNPRIEGLEGKEWVLMDFFDVIIHVMLSSSREFYKLEKLWGDATFYKLSKDGKAIKVSSKESIKFGKELV